MYLRVGIAKGPLQRRAYTGRRALDSLKSYWLRQNKALSFKFEIIGRLTSMF